MPLEGRSSPLSGETLGSKSPEGTGQDEGGREGEGSPGTEAPEGRTQGGSSGEWSAYQAPAAIPGTETSVSSRG